MRTDSPFKPLPDETETRPTVTFSFNDQSLTVPAGANVAAALLMSGIRRFRATPVSESPRAPYCMMGVCFECLLEIDGVPNRQGCLTEVADGMCIRSQEGARDLVYRFAGVEAVEVRS
ncbi:(2Fe-2S)-binding protein [Pseudomonas fulva]|nr:(2Fe-2S)-binding protein [Pseudomonas fulva]MBF8780236.1 (2Fe-2S)-binding protein [Pseudomonas fulva]